ncbi:CGNR zinc finger domain-containing protein [Micromonospora sp. NPDC049559]|uniref:CGNR zinc finger domain-containing protein n=1 Tax=Micromonospora sp. NPDC049559 TaxID=3155923 RepID=UPI003433F44C
MDASGNPELRLVGGHPALDLVNTVAPRRPDDADRHEYLAGPDELIAWAERAGIVDATEADAVARAWRGAPDGAEQALRAAVDVREATYRVLLARQGVPGAPQPEPALERLALRWAAAAARSELLLDPTGAGAVRLRVGTAPALLVPDRLAYAAVELLRTVDLGRLRTCPLDEGGCGWLFLDSSRNGSRRWCAMADCGAHAKARRLTARRRAARLPA